MKSILHLSYRKPLNWSPLLLDKMTMARISIVFMLTCGEDLWEYRVIALKKLYPFPPIVPIRQFDSKKWLTSCESETQLEVIVEKDIGFWLEKSKMKSRNLKSNIGFDQWFRCFIGYSNLFWYKWHECRSHSNDIFLLLYVLRSAFRLSRG